MTRHHSASGSQTSSDDVDDEIGILPLGIVRCADLALADADNVVEAAVGVAVAEMKDGADDLPSSGWVRAAVSVQLEHDCRAVVGVDDGAEVRTERPGGGSAMREVRATEASVDRALAAALGQEQVLLPPALERDRPALGIGEANPVQVLELHGCTPLPANRPVGALQTGSRGATRHPRVYFDASPPASSVPVVPGSVPGSRTTTAVGVDRRRA